MTSILTQEEIDLLQIAASSEAGRIRREVGKSDQLHQLRKAKILEELSDHLRTSQYVELP